MLHTDVAAYVKGVALSGVFRIQSEQSEMSSIRATFFGYLLRQGREVIVNGVVVVMHLLDASASAAVARWTLARFGVQS